MEPSFYFVRDSTRFSELPRLHLLLPNISWVFKSMRGSRRGSDPLKNRKNIGFLSNTGLDLLKFSKFSKLSEASIQWLAIIGTQAKRHLNGVSFAGRCWPAFSGIWILSPGLTYCQCCRVGPPLTKLSGSEHEKNHYIDNRMQNRQALTRGYIMLNTYLERVRVCRPGV